LDTLVDTTDGIKPIKDIRGRIDRTVYNGEASLVSKTSSGTVQFIWEIETENGHTVRCSDSHKWVRDDEDTTGRPARFLKVGDTLLTKEGVSKIVRKDQKFGTFRVKMITLPPPHLYWANGVASHNQKPRPQELPD
jgi:hypothetical protein